MNDIVSKEVRAPIKYEAGGGVVPATFEEAYRMANMFSASDLVPKDYRGKPENCMVAMQMGAEIGLKPMQALQGIAVINGRPSIWGDALWSLVQASPVIKDCHESFDEATMTATCSIHRYGRSAPTVATFSKLDAEKAGLWNKDGPWKGYPKRMLKMRARAFAARDAVPDVLKGLCSAEEAGDIIDIEPVRVVEATPPSPTPQRGVAGLKDRIAQRKEPEQAAPTSAVPSSPAEPASGQSPRPGRQGAQSVPAVTDDLVRGEPGPTLGDVVALLKRGDLDGAADIAQSLTGADAEAAQDAIRDAK